MLFYYFSPWKKINLISEKKPLLNNYICHDDFKYSLTFQNLQQEDKRKTMPLLLCKIMKLIQIYTELF
jgi:hypothetical protein